MSASPSTQSTSREPVSVIVCTRDRHEQLANTLDSVLASAYEDFELIVVDQSAGPETRALVESLAEKDRRVVYRLDAGKGLSRSRNIGLSMARNEIVVFTDDDCVVDRSWLSIMTDALLADRGAGIAFGTVAPAPCDPKDGFIVGYLPHTRERLTGRLAKLRDAGIGANMGFRKEVFRRVGYFDEMLGAGAYLSSAEDCDMTYRVLLGGYALLHIPESVVVHYGLRDWQSGSALIAKTFEAVAATYTKPLRRGDAVAGLLLLQQMGMAFGNIGIALLRMRKPFGFRRALSLFAGIRKGFQLEVRGLPLVYLSPQFEANRALLGLGAKSQ